jgi:hypothetical protein
MEPKRRTAASVFKENVVQQEVAEVDEYALPAAAAPPAPKLAASSAGYAPPSPPPPRQQRNIIIDTGLKTSEELQLEKEPIRVRETGFWIWRHIIVPPNAYVVHTRLGRKEPVTLGLGVSFRYNPYTDAYLVVPAAM